MTVTEMKTGKVISTVPISAGVDAVAMINQVHDFARMVTVRRLLFTRILG